MRRPGAVRRSGCFRPGGFGGARGGGAGRPGGVWALHRGKMADREEALREFVAVTGAEEERARFFLESAGWDLQVPLPLPSALPGPVRGSAGPRLRRPWRWRGAALGRRSVSRRLRPRPCPSPGSALGGGAADWLRLRLLLVVSFPL